MDEIASCVTLAGDLMFDDVEWLKGIPLPNLETVEGMLTIDNNDNLTSLDGLSNLTTVGVNISVQHNAKLCEDDVDEFIEGVDVDGTPWVYGNLGDCD